MTPRREDWPVDAIGNRGLSPDAIASGIAEALGGAAGRNAHAYACVRFTTRTGDTATVHLQPEASSRVAFSVTAEIRLPSGAMDNIWRGFGWNRTLDDVIAWVRTKMLPAMEVDVVQDSGNAASVRVYVAGLVKRKKAALKDAHVKDMRPLEQQHSRMRDRNEQAFRKRIVAAVLTLPGGDKKAIRTWGGRCYVVMGGWLHVATEQEKALADKIAARERAHEAALAGVDALATKIEREFALAGASADVRALIEKLERA